MKAMRVFAGLGLLGLLWLALRVGTACDTAQPVAYPDGGGLKEGSPCSSTESCDRGLVCSGSGTCQLVGTKGTRSAGEGCAYDTDCVFELVCASSGRCEKAGTGKAGDPCVGNESCGKGLLCSSSGACTKAGDPGAKGPGAECGTPTDCALGLVCLEGKCTPLAFWPGVSCQEDKGAIRAYFEIPRAKKPIGDFYRLPFPNDIRLRNGRVDVADHPNPGTALPKEYGDVVGSYLKAIGEDVTGFGLNTTAFLRVSKDFDLDTIKLDFLNIDKASPGYGQGVGWSMYATTGGGKYICPNFIAIRPSVGRPLAAKTTYAVLLRGGIKDASGASAAQDADFKLVIGESEPADAEEKAAWNAYAPLRAYLKEKSIPLADVLSAAVFTTMDPRARMAQFRGVTHAEAAPAATGLALCDGKTKSPCDDGKDPTWKCGETPDPAFHELQGSYETPVFQAGTAPYKTLADGGAIGYDTAGKPTVVRKDKVCYALSIPKGASMPAEGWPVVIFAHGTGGSYRSFLGNGTAAALADLKDASGGSLGRFAVIGIDGSMHGPRRGSSDKPDDLFFNLKNPKAARDNTYQGAADKFQLVRLIGALNLEAASSPTGEALKLDPKRIYYFGHSQGTIEGIPFLAFEPEVKGTVLSGAGGFLINSLLGKTKPVNVAAAVQFVLADGHLSDMHPLLNLLQLYFEEIDSVNYGAAIFSSPTTGVDPKHTLLGYGVADSYTPPGTIRALAWSTGISQVGPAAARCGDGVCGGSESCKSCVADCKKCPEGSVCGDGTCSQTERCEICPEDCKPCAPPFPILDPPVKENWTAPGGKKVTAGLVQHSSDGSYDDHFVLFQHPAGKQQCQQFLGTALKDGAPTIPAAK
jgi:pimeloyl-ACP methyl ester carboxylesterase